jgi:7-cyano-7-deazaguanine synthase in queuosine biosynthesis
MYILPEVTIEEYESHIEKSIECYLDANGHACGICLHII